MKITTTQTKTETVEIEINFPTFTKVVDGYSTRLYCIKSEKDITRVEQYSSGGITNVSKFSSISDAFTEGFEFISQDEFMQYYQDTIDKLYADLSVMKEMSPKPEKFMLQDFIDEMEQHELEQQRKDAEEQMMVDEYRDKINEY
jgi:hypothetical protein